MKWFLLACLVMVAASAAFAGGDKVHGDKGQGKVVQVVGP
ncbi:MAG: hypothetical protein BWZ02_00198 [Lentisphaerae bacterium ADurb.BinA184]|nr:MAG: hypothetical protein BWZ02_00198 [Lentisphaerae bacterium ADurb.BinA184]